MIVNYCYKIGLTDDEKTYWNEYKSETCYRNTKKNIGYQKKSFYKEKGYYIIKFKAILENKEMY